MAKHVDPIPLTLPAVLHKTDGTTEEVKYEFTALPRMNYQHLLGMIKNENNGRSLDFLDRMIRRSLRDDDGTPARWRPNVVDGHFTDPNGDHTPADLLGEYQKHEAGSSRRRWVELMEHEDFDHVDIDLEDIAELFEKIAEAVAGRPTRRS